MNTTMITITWESFPELFEKIRSLKEAPEHLKSCFSENGISFSTVIKSPSMAHGTYEEAIKDALNHFDCLGKGKKKPFVHYKFCIWLFFHSAMQADGFSKINELIASVSGVKRTNVNHGIKSISGLLQINDKSAIKMYSDVSEYCKHVVSSSDRLKIA